jgi:hypothetical protein
LKHEDQRERVRKDSRQVETKEKYGGEMRENLFLGRRRRSILLLEDSQSMLAHPFYEERVRVKKLGW